MGWSSWHPERLIVSVTHRMKWMCGALLQLSCTPEAAGLWPWSFHSAVPPTYLISFVTMNHTWDAERLFRFIQSLSIPENQQLVTRATHTPLFMRGGLSCQLPDLTHFAHQSFIVSQREMSPSQRGVKIPAVTHTLSINHQVIWILFSSFILSDASVR